MASRTPALFLNPIAGRGRAKRRLPRILALLEETGIHVVVHQSVAAGDLERQVREAVTGGATQLIVAGGDGSIHEAVNGIMAAGGGAALGIVPVGTGNDFAKAAGIPLDWEAATALLARRITDGAPPRSVDLGRMNDRWFANGAGIGLDARVTKIARSYRWPVGDLVYLVAIFHAMLEGIATPDRLETSIGTLTSFDGVPDKATTQTVYDELDLQRATQAFLSTIQVASLVAMEHGIRQFGPPTPRRSCSRI
jgi:diacylglycerol kinase (ATP)